MVATQLQHKEKKTLNFVITASSLGTLIEWYDFYIYGILATILTKHFFPASNPTAGFLGVLAIFASGFIVRPFGALFFGKIGDVVGRKYAFLVTLLMMGISTALIGVLPTYQQVGIVAPILLTLLRLIQGLAMGGEYGGAATYIAEHAPDSRRGYYTSFIQTTASLGFFISLLVYLGTEKWFGKEALEQWAWRVPFLLSMLLVIVSIVIRLRMAESPLFTRLKQGGGVSKNPIRESFVNPDNRRLVLIALFGATMGQGVIWYTGQFFAMTFMEKALSLDRTTSYITVAIAVLLATPFFIVFGHLSDKVGRKTLIVSSCLAAAVVYYPIYHLMVEAAKEPPNFFLLGVLVWVQVMLVTIVYGPIAAYLVEIFPTRIRYTSMSVPYHIGNGVFGGLTPLIANLMIVQTGIKASGVFFPILISLICAIVGWKLLPDKTGAPLDEA